MDRCSPWPAGLRKIPAIPCSNYSLPGGFSSSAANMPTFSIRENTSPWKSKARGQCTCCAFAREYQPPSGSPRQVAIIIAPRLIAQLTPLPENSPLPPPPLGPAVWEDTRIMLGDLASSPLKNMFTGQVLPGSGFACPAGNRVFRFSGGIADKGAITQGQAAEIVRRFKYRFLMSLFSFCLAATRRGACEEGVKKALEIHRLMKINISAQIHPRRISHIFTPCVKST